MKDDFTKQIGTAVVLIAGLLILDRIPSLMARSQGLRRLAAHSPILRGLEKLPDQMHNGELNPEDFDALAAGYYEGLRKDAGPIGLPLERDDIQFRDDFLRYEFKPNVKRSYPAGMRITNSLGMPNPEYSYEKPSHTRRIALLGDSISLGPYGHDYEALLEQRLNQAHLTPETQAFQVLNFAVYGYSIVQMMDVALEKAPQFHPDVYVVAMTHLEVMPKAGWRTHVGRLVVSGTDLKYDFLRTVAAQAGVRPTDHLPTVRMKLKPYFRQVVRQAVERIRDHAASQGARMIVVLVPAPIDPNFSVSDFNTLHQSIDGIGVPIVDLRDTFRSVNLSDYQVVPREDIHPNGRGHEMIFGNLYDKLRAQPEAWAAVAGSGAESAHQAGAAPTVKAF
jgi:hypothetical protein